MKEMTASAATIVCIGGSTERVRGTCAIVRQSGYRAIALITEVNPRCTLPLLSTLLPNAVIIMDDLPDLDGKSFAAVVQRLYPGIQILLLADDHEPTQQIASSETFIESYRDVVDRVSALLRAVV